MICWLVYHPRARDATQDVDGANFAARAPLSIWGGTEKWPGDTALGEGGGMKGAL